MPHVMISSLIQKRVLTARDSVDAIAPSLINTIADGAEPLILDFHGVGLVSPSAIDQLLLRINSGPRNGDIQLANMPVPSSQVHHSIARAHGRVLVENGPHFWVFKASVESHA